MLDFGRVGSGGQAKRHTAMILGTIVVLSTPSSILKRAPSSLWSFVIGILVFVLPSSLTSPALQQAPSLLSFHSISPLDYPRAQQQSITSPTHIVIVMAICAFSSASHTQMMVDIDSLDILHTLGVCRCHVQW